MGTFDPVRRNRRIDPYTFLGFPDITAFVPGLVFIEAKSLTGRMSEAQKDFQQLCKIAGVKYILARSLEDVINGLLKHD